MESPEFKNLHNLLSEYLKTSEFKTPTEFQKIFVPESLKEQDLLGIASTGSGKTISFVLPIISSLLKKNFFNHSIVIVPTRELALQVNNVFLDIGDEFGLKTCLLIGGDDFNLQKQALGKKPHVIIGTPGRLADHKICYQKIKFLILDEADKLFEKNFEEDIKNILAKITAEKKNLSEGNKDFQTFLFSATLTPEISEANKLILKNPKILSLNTKPKISESFIFVGNKYKITNLFYLLKEEDYKSCIVFVSSSSSAGVISKALNSLDLNSEPLFGNMTQSERKNCMKNFREKKFEILIATDVASRGLDIPEIDLIINYDIPDPKTYTHRVGRTGRYKNEGRSISIVTQYDIIPLQKIEFYKKSKIAKINLEKEKVMTNFEKVNSAFRTVFLSEKEGEKKDSKKSKKKQKF